MLATLSCEEYTNWLAFFDEEGFPQDRTDVRNAELLAVIMNSSGRYRKTFKVGDFLYPKWEVDPAERNLEQQAEADKAFGAQLMALKAQT